MPHEQDCQKTSWQTIRSKIPLDPPFANGKGIAFIAWGECPCNSCSACAFIDIQFQKIRIHYVNFDMKFDSGC